MSKILFLGVEGSGKSTLTAAFVAYLSKHAEWGWSLRPENKEAFAFSSQMIPKFVAGELPGQTARFRRLRWPCSLRWARRTNTVCRAMSCMM